MKKLLIIADDFTGALDTGVQFAKNGIHTSVSFEKADMVSSFDDTEVLVVDTESRHDAPETAYKKVYDASAEAYSCGVDAVYKKTDSALRGNIGSELQALLDASHNSVLEFVPAFPKNGRTTTNGMQYINGCPVSESVFGKDPFNPVIHSYVPDIIAEQSDAHVILRSPEYCERAAIRVYDAETERDLAEISQLMAQTNGARAFAGCAGFAEYLPRVIGLSAGKSKIIERKKRSLLIISGSLNKTTLNQTDFAKSHGVFAFTLTKQQTQETDFWKRHKNGYFSSCVGEGLAARGTVIIESANRMHCGLIDDLAAADELTRERQRLTTLENIADMAMVLNKTVVPDVMAVFGGDTLMSIMKKLNCICVKPIIEIESGVVLSEAILPDRQMYLVSKSGGLGSEDVVSKIIECVSADTENSQG